MGLVRAFLGVGASPALSAAIGQWRTQHGPMPGLRWVADHNLHMTLVFLGIVAEGQLPVLARAITPVVAAQSPIDVHWHAVSWFPDAQRPRVLALLPQPNEALQHWHQQTCASLRAQGFVLEAQPYRPHISLARVRHTHDVPLQAGGMAQAMQVRQLTLFRSDSTANGVHYTACQSWLLGG
ncbi:MAG TPA: RNA 2',3'-cyclic phosphodiesterase [Pseudomonadales bacterium]